MPAIGSGNRITKPAGTKAPRVKVRRKKPPAPKKAARIVSKAAHLGEREATHPKKTAIQRIGKTARLATGAPKVSSSRPKLKDQSKRQVALSAINKATGNTIHHEPAENLALNKKTGRIVTLSDMAPKGIQIVRALTGDEPGDTKLSEIESIGETLALGALGKGFTAARTAKELQEGTAASKAASKLRGVRAAPAERVASRSAPKVERSAPKTRSVQAAKEGRQLRDASKLAKTPRQKRAMKAVRASKAREYRVYKDAERAKGVKKAKAGAKAKAVRHVEQARRLKARPVGTTANAALRASEKAGHAAVSPAALTPGVRDRGTAFVDGTFSANVGKSAKTTARALPSALTYPATVLYDAGHTGVRATREGLADAGLPGGKHYSGKEIIAPVKGAAEEGVAAFKPVGELASGDPAKVRKATESEVGYLFAPGLPKLGELSRKPLSAAVRSTKEKLPKKPRRSHIGEGPSRAQEVAGFVKGRKARKRVSVLAAREIGRERHKAGKAAHEIRKPANKLPKDAGGLITVISRYGISRKNALAQLREVRDSLHGQDMGKDFTTTRKVVEYAERNPKVLEDKNLWKSVDAYKARAKEVETSPRATHLAQARVLGGGKILKPEERAPGGGSREAAFKELEAKTKLVTQERKKANEAMIAAHEAKGDRREELLDIRDAHRAASKRFSREAKELHRDLDKFSRPGQSLEGKRKPWSHQMVEDFVAETKDVAKKRGFEEPAWVSEPVLPGEGEVVPRYNASASRAQHVSKGKAEAADIADRSLPALLARSVYGPRVQRALHRLTRRATEEFAKPKVLDGKTRTAFTHDEIGALAREGYFDPRKEVIVPSRQWKQSMAAEDFDLPEYHTDFNRRLRTEWNKIQDEPGTKYTIWDREPAKEFSDQINPEGPGLEKVLSGFGMVGSRAILGYSPAWMLAQVVAEGLQTYAATGLPRALRAVRTLQKLKKDNPKGYEDFASWTGESAAAYETPHNLRVESTAEAQRTYAGGVEAIRRNVVGRTIYDALSGKLLGIFDRWKGGKYRSIITAAHADKELNSFLGGLKGTLRSESGIAKELKGMDRPEQLAWIAKHPREMERHLNYLDDVMGNWTAYTRFEKQFAPALIFYPFLRMSLRWTFQTYPKAHPVKASILYLLAQQNSNELEKLLGAKPSRFFQYANPVVHGDNGPDAILPGGQRFGAPGSNTLIEAIGEDNSAAVFRALNPFLSTGIYAGTHTNPLTGEKDDTSVGLSALQQLLSMPAPARLFGVSHLGEEQSPISKRFQELDPNRQARSFLLPFLPQDADSARKANKLSTTLNESSAIKSEVGQFMNLVDQYGLEKAKVLLKKDMAASEELQKVSGGGDKEAQKIIDAYYKIKYGGGSSSSSGGLSGGGLSGGGLSGGGL